MMMESISEIILSVVAAFVIAVPTAAAVYGALRKELEWLRSDISRNMSDAQEAHKRMDDHITTYHFRKNDPARPGS